MLDIDLQVWQIESISCFPVEKVKEKQGKMLRTAQWELCLPRYAGHTLGRPIPETMENTHTLWQGRSCTWGIMHCQWKVSVNVVYTKNVWKSIHFPTLSKPVWLSFMCGRQKEIFWKRLKVFCSYSESQWDLIYFGPHWLLIQGQKIVETFFKISSFIFNRRK